MALLSTPATPLIKFLLFTTLLFTVSYADDDADLTGCNVELDSYFFNLIPLSHSTEYSYCLNAF